MKRISEFLSSIEDLITQHRALFATILFLAWLSWGVGKAIDQMEAKADFANRCSDQGGTVFLDGEARTCLIEWKVLVVKR
jgi:hypothetical protein